MHWHFSNWIVMAIYFIFMFLIGVYFSKKQTSSSDYFTASGRVPTIVASCSIYATMLSSISFIAIPALIFRTNWVNGIQSLGTIVLVFFVAFLYVPFVRRLKVTTAYEYLEARFEDKLLRIISSLIFVAFHISRIAIVIYLPTLALMVALPDVNPIAIALITAIFCIAYTSMGGIEAVVWSDFYQTIVLVLGAIILIIFGFASVPGGVGEAFKVLHADGKIFPAETLEFSFSKATIWVLLLGGFSNSIFAYVGSQDVVQRYTTVKNLKEAQRSILMNAPLLIVSVIMFIGTGSAIYLFYKFNGGAPELSNQDAILPFMVVRELPMVFSGLIMAGLIAAAQSTISSSLNSSATCLVVDILGSLKIKLSDNQKLAYGKHFSMIIGVLGTILAIVFLKKGQNDLFLYFQSILAMLGGPVVTMFLVGIFITKANRHSVWVGFIVSSLLAFMLTNPGKIINLLITNYKPITLYPFALPVIIIGGGMISALVSSYFFLKPSNTIIENLTYKGLKDTSDIE